VKFDYLDYFEVPHLTGYMDLHFLSDIMVNETIAEC